MSYLGKGINQWYLSLDGKSVTIVITSKKHGVFETVIDVEDWPRVQVYRWTVMVAKRSRNVYFHAQKRLPDGTLEYKRLHMFIMGDPEGMVVDHRMPEEHLDNRKSNLRVATQGQNLANQRKRLKPSSSIYKGVFKRTRDILWSAQISLNSRNKQIGRFETELEAAVAYDRAAIEHYGEYALLNFPVVNYTTKMVA